MKMKMAMMFFFFLLSLFLLSLFQLQGVGAGGGAGAGAGDECKGVTRRCGDYGLDIRFPFWLKDQAQPNQCGYPAGFELSCSPSNNDTLLDLPFFKPYSVRHINYKDQTLHLYDPSGCFLEQLLLLNLNPNLSASPFKFSPYSFYYNYSFLSCPPSPTKQTNLESNPYLGQTMFPITKCNSSNQEGLYGILDDHIIQWPQLFCRKLYTVSSIEYPAYHGLHDLEELYYLYDYENHELYILLDYYAPYVRLSWSKPICGRCEEIGKYCRLRRRMRNNSSSSSRNHNDDETECLGNIISNQSPPTGFSEEKPEILYWKDQEKGKTKRLVLKGVIPSGLFLLLVVMVTIYFVHRSNKLKKEDGIKIERFLEDYRALKPTRYTYAEIKKITNNFKDKLGQGGYGTVYKGKLSNDVHIAAKTLNDFKGDGEDFINEVGTIGRIHHINVVRLVGYCADGFKRALVYEYLPNDSLEKFISSDHKKCSLGWEKLQDIALGIAKGIEYLHQGCDQRILHFDIKPHNILLDHKFNPKISDFGLAKLCSKEQSAISMTAARGTVGYIAPEVFSRNFGNVSYKSDVYSFGMLLLEMVGGRKNTNVIEQNTSEVYFPEWIYNRLNHGEEHGIVIEEDGDAKIVKKLTIVGLWCIQWYPGDRPAMKVVVKMLEGDGDTLTMPPNPFATSNPRAARGGRPFDSKLEIISESE